MEGSFPGNINEHVIAKQRIIDAVIELPPEKRVAKLIELGVLTDLGGYSSGHFFAGDDPSRFFVFANFKGVPVPMYKSMSHTSNKRGDLNFFVFWGIWESRNSWIMKGDRKEVNEFYGVKELEDISSILTSTFDFDTFIQVQPESGDVNGYIPEGNRITSYQKLNELLGRRFDIDFSKLNAARGDGRINDDTIAQKILNEARGKSQDK